MCEISKPRIGSRGTLERRSSILFAIGVLLFAVSALLLTAAAPIGSSMAILFLFAGPHLYVETRYFLTRLTSNLKPLRAYLLFSAGGLLILSIAVQFVPWLGPFGHVRPATESAMIHTGLWNTMFIFWCAGLARIRCSQEPCRNWDYIWPVAFGAAGIAWMLPSIMWLVLVFGHPVIALWLLDREIVLSRPHWSTSYRFCVGFLVIMLISLWTMFPVGSLDTWPSIYRIDRQIAEHAGVPFFSEATSGRLIASLAFLELLHYGVWIIAIPIANSRVLRFQSIPMMKETGVTGIVSHGSLILSLTAVIALWLFFHADYSTTRSLYLTIAMVHVFAEIPLLVKML